MVRRSSVVIIALSASTTPFRTQAFQTTALSSRCRSSALFSTTEEPEVISPITGSVTNVKYPTQRGAEVDSRKIINYNEKVGEGINLALRLSHILFASEELANQVRRWTVDNNFQLHFCDYFDEDNFIENIRDLKEADEIKHSCVYGKN